MPIGVIGVEMVVLRWIAGTCAALYPNLTGIGSSFPVTHSVKWLTYFEIFRFHMSHRARDLPERIFPVECTGHGRLHPSQRPNTAASRAHSCEPLQHNRRRKVWCIRAWEREWLLCPFLGIRNRLITSSETSSSRQYVAQLGFRAEMQLQGTFPSLLSSCFKQRGMVRSGLTAIR